jgi:hypothetical protein
VDEPLGSVRRRMRGDCFAQQKPQTLRLKRFIATPAARFKRIDVKNVVLTLRVGDLRERS